jgi:hypothetical protein
MPACAAVELVETRKTNATTQYKSASLPRKSQACNSSGTLHKHTPEDVDGVWQDVFVER